MVFGLSCKIPIKIRDGSACHKQKIAWNSCKLSTVLHCSFHVNPSKNATFQNKNMATFIFKKVPENNIFFY